MCYYRDMNLLSIVILLQTVLALLSNPSTAHDPKTKVLAIQAIEIAQNSISESISKPVEKPLEINKNIPIITQNHTHSIDTNDPVINPPSCILSMWIAGFDPGILHYSWELRGAIDSRATGTLRSLNDYDVAFNAPLTPDHNPAYTVNYPKSSDYEANFKGVTCKAHLPILNPWTYGSSTIIKSTP